MRTTHLISIAVSVISLLFQASAFPSQNELLAPTVPIVFVSRDTHADGSYHWPAVLDGPSGVPGVGPRTRLLPSTSSRLLVREPDGAIRVLIDGDKPTPESLYLVDVNAPAVSYDGNLIAFAGLSKESYEEEDFSTQFGVVSTGGWRIYLINADGTGLVQLTKGRELDILEFVNIFGQIAGASLYRFDDFDPVFLPSGSIVFSSTRWPSFSQFGSHRTSQLYTVNSDGSRLHRFTSERNGADRPIVDPLTGHVVFARWWTNGRFPTNSTASISDSGGFQVHLGLKSSPEPHPIEKDDVVGAATQLRRTSWHAAQIRPDGYELVMFAGHMRLDSLTHYYGGSFSDDGVLFANYFPVNNMVEASGLGGVRKVLRGASPPVGILGVNRATAEQKYFDNQSLFATDAIVLPDRATGLRDGNLVVSMTTVVGDLKQDYGLYLSSQDGQQTRLLLDFPETAELRAQVLAPRKLPPKILNFSTSSPHPLPPAVTEVTTKEQRNQIMKNGLFIFNPLNVYANADVDVGIVSAIPVGSAKTLRAFTDYQRTTAGFDPGLDWPILLDEVPVDSGGAAVLTAPAHLPLFEDIRGPDNEVPLAGGYYGQGNKDKGSAFVAGFNYAPAGFHSRCIGCHAGHSLMKTPASDEEAKWSNLAPGARVYLSAVSDLGLEGQMEASLVDRKLKSTVNYETTWHTDETGTPWARLVFPVPVWIREVRLHNFQQDSLPRVKTAQVRLFENALGETELGSQPVKGFREGISSAFFDTEYQPNGVQVVEVEILTKNGPVNKSFVGLGEVEVIARGDKPQNRMGESLAPKFDTPIIREDDYFSEQQTTVGGERLDFKVCPSDSKWTYEHSFTQPKSPYSGFRILNDALELDPDSDVRARFAIRLQAQCEDCVWSELTLDRRLSLQSDILVRYRVGSLSNWEKWSKYQRGTEISIDEAEGENLDLEFNFIAAERHSGPSLFAFRACAN